MTVNNALNSRTLNTYGSAMNEYMIYSKLTSLIEQYNRLAIVKGLPVKKVPIYTGHINETLITRSINTILNDIDKLQSIKDRAEGPPLRYGVYDGEFPDVTGTFEIGSWKYMVGELEGNIGLNVSINDMTITEMPGDLPFNVITDNQGNILNVIAMSGMFSYCGGLTSIDLSNFDTSSVTDMSNMFGDCTNLTIITFGDKFDTSRVTDMAGMFGDCTNLTSITFYKVSENLLFVFPGATTDWSVNGTSLTDATWKTEWGDGPVTFTRTL